MTSKKNSTSKKADSKAAARRAAFLANYRRDIKAPLPAPAPPAHVAAAALRAKELGALLDAAISAFDADPHSEAADNFAAAIDRAWFGYLSGDKDKLAILLLVHAIATCADLDHGPGPVPAMVATKYPELAEKLDDALLADAVASWAAKKSDKWTSVVALSRKAGLAPPTATSLAQYYSKMRARLKAVGWFDGSS